MSKKTQTVEGEAKVEPTSDASKSAPSVSSASRPDSFDPGPLVPKLPADLVRGAVNEKGVTVNPYLLPQEKKIWEPDFEQAGKALQPVRCRLVDYGDDQGAYHVGYASVRPRRSDNSITPTESPFLYATDFDVDGDGQVKDEVVKYLKFSMDESLSAPAWPLSDFLPGTNNGRYFGGLAVFTAGTKLTEKKVSGVSGWESGINPNHSGPYEAVWAENTPLNAESDSRFPNSWHKAYWWLLWKKADFLNGGDRYRVSFDETSRIAAVIGRGYFWGVDVWSYIVQNGEKFYISDPSHYDLPTEFGLDGGFSAYVPMIFPSKVKWAEVPRPEGFQMQFDAKKADFQERTFDDIQSVGWLVGKGNKLPMSTHVKWYAFAVDAVVHTPTALPSTHIAVATANEPTGGDFFMATTEVSYSLWRDIYRWANTPVYTFEPRYIFERRGDMGSMALGTQIHTADEPVTGIAYRDALAWCNALSELEGKQPAYYADPEMKIPFRNFDAATLVKGLKKMRDDIPRVKLGENIPVRYLPRKPIYVKWDSDGWRLPTQAEWLAATNNKISTNTTPKESTLPVGTDKADSNGSFYDLGGNVRELVWTAGDVLDADFTSFCVMGGDFTSKAAGTVSASPYGDKPFDASFQIGFRPVCRTAGGVKPAQTAQTDDSPLAWTIEKGKSLPAATEPVVAADSPLIETISLPAGVFKRKNVRAEEITISLSPFALGKNEITYEEWREVRDWAEARGYQFGNRGDMGSMAYFSFPHSPQEPVTCLTSWDMIVWCNALSEREGLRPFYYEDRERTKPIRSAYIYRPAKFPTGQYCHVREKKWRGATYPDDAVRDYLEYMHGSLGRSYLIEPWIWQDWTAPGYRLPTYPEYEFAARGGTDTQYFWGISRENENDFAWTIRNGGGRTHPVAQKKPNSFGFYDLVGNVGEVANGLAGNDRDAKRADALDTQDPKYNRHFWLDMDAADLTGPGISNHRTGVVVGSSWMYGSPSTGGAESLYHTTGPSSTIGYPDLGFRIARSLPAPTEIPHPLNGNFPLAENNRVDAFPWQDLPYDSLAGKCFRGDLMRTGTLDVAAPTSTPTIAWKTELGGQIKSSPVAIGNSVYIGAETSFHCLDLESGKILWSFPVPGGVESSACIAGNAVYFGGMDGYLYALDCTTGKLLWSSQATEKTWLRGQVGLTPVTSSPAVAHGAVFCSLGAGLMAFDAQDGRWLWTYTATANTAIKNKTTTLGGWGAPTISPNGKIYGCFNHTWGQTVEVELGTGYGLKPFYANNDAGYFNSVAFWQSEKTIAFVSSRCLYLFNLDCPTGSDATETRVMAKVMPNVGTNEFRINTAPAVWKNLAVWGTDDGHLHAWSPDGKPRWQFATDAPVQSSPTIATRNAQVLFGAHSGTLYCLDLEKGIPTWRLKLPAAIKSSPWLTPEGKILVTCDDGFIYALEAQ